MKLKHMAAVAAASISFATTTVHAQELKFANFAPPFHTINASVIEKINETLSTNTNGDLTVRGYHGGELGAGPVEQYVRVLQGAADMAWGLPGYTSSQFSKTMIAELPGVIPAEVPGYKAIWAAYGEHLANEFPGTKPLALWTAEPNALIMKDKAVRTPDDLKGLKIRVAGATAAEVVTALGATPVQMPISQVYNALQTGLIDGVITGHSVLKDFKLDEVADAVTLGAPLGRVSFYTVMNLDVYNELSGAQKAALDSVSGVELSKSAEDAWMATANAALEMAKADSDNTIIELSAAEAVAFARATQSVVEAYVKSVDGADALAAMGKY